MIRFLERVYVRLAKVPKLGRLVQSTGIRRLGGLWGRRVLRDADNWDDVEWGLRLVANDGVSTLVVPAWTGSLAEEVLYWRPFVRWLVEFASETAPAERLHVVVRPETAHWYGLAEATCVASAPAAEGRNVVFDTDVFLHLRDAFTKAGGPIRPLLRHARYVAQTRPGAPARSYTVLVGAEAVEAWAGEAVTGPPPAGELEPVVSGAGGAIGTWGDPLALALLYGIPSVVLAPGGDDALQPHLDIVQRVARMTETSLTVIDLDLLDTLAAAAPTRAAHGVHAIRVS